MYVRHTHTHTTHTGVNFKILIENGSPETDSE